MKSKEMILMQAQTAKVCADEMNNQAGNAAIESDRMLKWLIENDAPAATIAKAAELAALAQSAKKIANDAAFSAGVLIAKVL